MGQITDRSIVFTPRLQLELRPRVEPKMANLRRHGATGWLRRGWGLRGDRKPPYDVVRKLHRSFECY